MTQSGGGKAELDQRSIDAIRTLCIDVESTTGPLGAGAATSVDMAVTSRRLASRYDVEMPR